MKAFKEEKRGVAKLGDFVKDADLEKLTGPKPTLVTASELKESAAPKAPQVKNYKYLPPVYATKLKERLGTRPAADALGISNTMLSRGILENEIAMAAELAAKGIWLSEFEPKPEPQVVYRESPAGEQKIAVFMRVTPPQLQALNAMVSGMGIDAFVIPE